MQRSKGNNRHKSNKKPKSQTLLQSTHHSKGNSTSPIESDNSRIAYSMITPGEPNPSAAMPPLVNVNKAKLFDTLHSLKEESNNNSVPKLLFNYTVYATTPQDFRSWVDCLFELFGKFATFFPLITIPIISLVYGIAVFLGGLLIASVINFGWVYITTPVIYVGIFGIAWVLGIIRYATQNIHSAYEELRPCFIVKDQEYFEKLVYWFERLASHKLNFLATFFWFILAITIVYPAYFAENILIFLRIDTLRYIVFGTEWFSADHLLVKFSIILYLGLCVAFPLATSFRLLLVNFLFLLDLRHFHVIPAVHIIRARLRSITNLYITVTLAWFLGVSLFGFVFFQDLGGFSFVFLGVLSIAGLLTFFTPQFVFRKYLLLSYLRSCDIGLYALTRSIGIDLVEREPKDMPSHITPRLKNIELSFSDIIDSTSPTNLWVYDFTDIVLLLLGQGIAIASVFIPGIK